jgi:c-di-GMP-binding flagellar brake protein YcgR
MDEDKRKYSRINWSVVVRWQKVQGVQHSEEQNVSASKDISHGGIRLILREGIVPGDILYLEIELGGGKSIHTNAKVVWVEKFEIIGVKRETGYQGGVQFLGLSEETEKLIADIMTGDRKGTA